MPAERGRPRTFDMDLALDQAIAVFWRHGFANTSMSALTEAMGLNKPSIYAAFGDKEALYLKALERYLQAHIAERAALLEAGPDARTAVENCLRSLAAAYANPTLPGGCFVANGVSGECGGSVPAAVTEALNHAIQSTESRFRAAMVRAQKEGGLPPSASPKHWALFWVSVVIGMSVLAKNGAKLSTLNHIIDTALQAWPESMDGPDV